jgi:hypothetical protein
LYKKIDNHYKIQKRIENMIKKLKPHDAPSITRIQLLFATLTLLASSTLSATSDVSTSKNLLMDFLASFQLLARINILGMKVQLKVLELFHFGLVLML